MRLFEVIKMPTGKPRAYLIYKHKEAMGLLPIATKIEQLSGSIDWRTFHDVIRNYIDQASTELIWDLENEMYKFTERTLLKQIIDNVGDGLKDNDLPFHMKHLLNMIGYNRFPVLDQGLVKILQNTEALNKYLPYYLDEEDPKEKASINATIQFSALLATFIPHYNKFITGFKSKLDATFNPDTVYIDFSKQVPTHDDTETMYHASAFAAQLEKEGFLAKIPKSRLGLSSGIYEDSLVSVTYDLYTAKEIARSLKELHMIAHEELKAPTIARWWNEEQLHKKTNEPLKDTIYRNISGTKQIHELNIEETASFYKWYMGMSDKREDPFYMNITKTVNILKGIDKNDIGVVQVEVDMRDEPEFLSGEKEYRITPNKILSVKRIL